MLQNGLPNVKTAVDYGTPIKMPFLFSYQFQVNVTFFC